MCCLQMVQLHVGEEMQFSAIERGTANPGGEFVYSPCISCSIQYRLCSDARG